MTPAEHYAEAERLLAGAQNVMDVAPIDGLTREECSRLAQVHATLATVPAFPTKWIESSSGTECTCPHLPSQPKALVGTDPACPIHGETP